MIKILNLQGQTDMTLPLRQQESVNKDISGRVIEIIEGVKKDKDKALRRYTKMFDGVDIENFSVSDAEMKKAYLDTDPELLDVMRKAAENIREFHEKQKRTGYTLKKDGIMMGQRVIPIESVGIYIPGGTAAYPSTVLMDIIPARIAGVKRIIMVTPPSSDGSVAPVILSAAAIAGADTVYKVGGAQAIAALAFGTETIPAVDKILGPGNIYVAEAKKQVFGTVGIDIIAGPSDILIIADDSSVPEYIAADLLSQAEHDENSSSTLITTSQKVAEKVNEEIERQIKELKREKTARESIERNGRIILVDSLKKAVELSNCIAPEHLELCVKNPKKLMESITNAGSIFLGNFTPEALGDYFAGPNHTLPTMGSARFSSPLGVDDFVKRNSFLCYSKEALMDAGPKVELFAHSEGLDAHAKSIAVRGKGD